MWKAAQFVTNVRNKQFVSNSGNSLSSSVSITTIHSCEMLWDKSGQVSEWERSATSYTTYSRDKNVPVDRATKHVPRLVARQWKWYATCSGTRKCAGALFTHPELRNRNFLWTQPEIFTPFILCCIALFTVCTVVITLRFLLYLSNLCASVEWGIGQIQHDLVFAISRLLRFNRNSKSSAANLIKFLNPLLWRSRSLIEEVNAPSDEIVILLKQF